MEQRRKQRIKVAIKRNKQKIADILLLGICLVAAGVYCVWSGQDANWDLQNYHLYNPFAFLHNRYGQDLFAAGIHSTMNPLLDIPYYLLFRAFFHHPVLLTFLWGFPYGLCVWLMYKIASRIFENRKWWWKVFAVLLAATAVGTFSQAGLITGEINNFITLLISLWCFVLFVQNPEKKKFLYWAGFLAGFAAGCKLTSSYYCIALFAALIPNVRYTKNPLKTVVIFCLLGMAGFLLTNGYFMWKWYSMYGNPFFPFYNNIFKSPYFDSVYLTESRFFPRTLSQLFFYPFYWIKTNTLVTECEMADKRMALGYISVIVLAYYVLRGKFLSVNRRLVGSLLILTTVSYIIWLCQFSIIRYACVIEFLACLLLFILLDSMTERPIKIVLAGVLVCVCIFDSEIPDWHHEDFGKDSVVEFTVKPEIEDNALVFLMHLPSSYLIPLLNTKASYMGGFISKPEEYPEEYRQRAFRRNNLQLQYFRYHMEDLQREKIARHEGPIYVVSIDWPMTRNRKTLARFGLQSGVGSCTPFKTNFTVYSPHLVICPVEKENKNEDE